MSGGRAKVSRAIFLIISLLAAAGELQASETERYDRRFFVQLRTVFGRFRNADLDRAFEKAQPIQCSELVNEEAEWRTVAFFNEKRELGDWSSDVCSSDLTTKFPV